MLKKELSDAAKDELALALLLLKDFKCNGRFDLEVTMMVFRLAEHLGVKEHLDRMLTKLPSMRIEPR